MHERTPFLKLQQVHAYTGEMASKNVDPATAAHSEPASASVSEPPRWLSDEERAAWLAVAGIMFTLPAALDARLQEEAGLTFFEYMVLSVLSEQADRTMQMSDIAAGVSASLSRLSHVAKKLENHGLLHRRRVPGSGRRTDAVLTEAGYSRVVSAAPGHLAAVREYFIDTLETADLPALRRIGGAVAGRIDPEHPFVHGTPIRTQPPADEMATT